MAGAHRGAVVPSPLPERVERYGVVVRRWEADDAPALHAAVLANLEHLRPFMPWVAHEPLSLQQRRALIEGWTVEWAGGGDLTVGIWRGDRVLGSAGLHRRLGPDGLEIGYWVDRDHLRQGVATAAARALTDLAFTVPGIERVRICHDADDAASARVPARLGYRCLRDSPAAVPEAAAGPGEQRVWIVTRDQWATTAHRS